MISETALRLQTAALGHGFGEKIRLKSSRRKACGGSAVQPGTGDVLPGEDGEAEQARQSSAPAEQPRAEAAARGRRRHGRHGSELQFNSL